MVARKDAKTKISSTPSNAGMAQQTEILVPKTKAEFHEKFVELQPFSTGMLIYNYFLYTV
jgi:hypothetical protein